MSATGIGAPVRRKEDYRFITGKGQYTDDLTRPGQTYITFVRSPHAHARIRRIDASAAKGMPGVVAVLTGADLAADKVGSLICGWAITSKDGSPMKMAPHPAIANTKANHVGDPVAVVVAETQAQAKDAAEKVVVDYEVLPAVVDPAKAQAKSAPQIHEVAPGNTIYEWHLGDQKAVEAAFKGRSTSPGWTSSTTGWCRTPWSRARRSPSTMPATTASRSGTRRRTRTWRGS